MGFQRHVVVPAVLALGLMLAGCVDNGYHGPKVATMLTGGAPATSAVQMSDEDRNRAFQNCMRENGADVVAMKENQSEPSEEQMTKMREAAEACRELLPNGGRPPPVDAKALDEQRKQAQCLRDKGIDAQDPSPDRPGMSIGDGVDFGSERFQKAMEECMPKPEPPK